MLIIRNTYDVFIKRQNHQFLLMILHLQHLNYHLMMKAILINCHQFQQ